MFSHLTSLVLLHYLVKYETQKKTAHWCTVRATQSNNCSALDVLCPESYFQQPGAERIDYQIQGVIQQREYESRVKKIEQIKQLVEFRQCTDTAFE